MSTILIYCLPQFSHTQDETTCPNLCTPATYRCSVGADVSVNWPFGVTSGATGIDKPNITSATVIDKSYTSSATA